MRCYDLSYTNVSESSFNDVDLTGANLNDVDFSGVRSMTRTSQILNVTTPNSTEHISVTQNL